MEWDSFYRLGQHRKARDLTEPQFAFFLAKRLKDSVDGPSRTDTS